MNIARIHAIVSEAKDAVEDPDARLFYLAGWIHRMETTGFHRNIDQHTPDMTGNKE